MLESSLQYLRCPHCFNTLAIEVFEQTSEIIEGVLQCTVCSKQYPVISSIPFMIQDISSYFSIRTKLGGDLMLNTKSAKLKSLIRDSLTNIKKTGEDIDYLEKRWVEIYKNSPMSQFEFKLTDVIQQIPKSELVLEHGCSIGKTTELLSKYHKHVFGLDLSFHALVEAKRSDIPNCDFVLGDSLSSPFGSLLFEIVLGLNLLELLEPIKLLDTLSLQTSKFLILSDPYDYERGAKTVKKQLTSDEVRLELTNKGFEFLYDTYKPNFHSWTLHVNERLDLHYKTDLIVAKKK